MTTGLLGWVVVLAGLVLIRLSRSYAPRERLRILYFVVLLCSVNLAVLLWRMFTD